MSYRSNRSEKGAVATAIGCIIAIFAISIASALFMLAIYFLVFQALLKYVNGG